MREWLARVLSSAQGVPSTKRHVVALAAGSLCLVFLAMGLGSAEWIRSHGDLGGGAVAALSFVGGILATLAGNAYRKPDGGIAVPPGGDGSMGAVDPSTHQEAQCHTSKSRNPGDGAQAVATDATSTAVS